MQLPQQTKRLCSKILSHIINIQSKYLLMSVGKTKLVYTSLIIIYAKSKSMQQQLVRVSNPDMGVNLDPTDKVFFFADSGSPGGPN